MELGAFLFLTNFGGRVSVASRSRISNSCDRNDQDHIHYVAINLEEFKNVIRLPWTFNTPTITAVRAFAIAIYFTSAIDHNILWIDEYLVALLAQSTRSVATALEKESC